MKLQEEPHTYKIQLISDEIVDDVLDLLPTDRIVRFSAHDSNVQLPSPGLLRVHAIIARILHDSGLLVEIEEESPEEYDDLHALAPDGSTDVSKPFRGRSLGALSRGSGDIER
jgi:hypothetical protein